MNLRQQQGVGRMRLAADGDAMHAERKAWLHVGERRLRALAAGEAVGQDADLMAALDLPLGEIEDVAKDAADRRAHGVQDSQRVGGNRSHGPEPPSRRRRRVGGQRGVDRITENSQRD